MNSCQKFSDRAVKNFKMGYNCAQSVLLAFSDELCIDADFALKLASSFGGGMGCLREVCGAVSAMFMVAGLLKGYTNPNDNSTKAAHYELIQTLAKEFSNKHRTIICRELLELSEIKSPSAPSARDDEYYSVRPCEHFIRTAADIIAQNLIL